MSDSQDNAAAWRVLKTLSRSDRGELLEVDRHGEHLVLRTGPGALAESIVHARHTHASLIAPLEAGRLPDGRPYLLRPWVDGVPFAEALRDAGPAARAALVVEALSALQALHVAGFVHRDVKGDNLLVDRGRVILLDLDLVVPAGLGERGAGTAHNLAPEVLVGQPATVASDLFSLGATMALAFGGTPAPGFHERFPLVSFWEAAGFDEQVVDPGLRELTRTLLRRRPSDRPRSAAEAQWWVQATDASRPAALEVPWSADRRAQFDRIVAAGRLPGVVLVAVDVAEEIDVLSRSLELDLLARGQEVARVPLVGGVLSTDAHRPEGAGGAVAAAGGRIEPVTIAAAAVDRDVDASGTPAEDVKQAGLRRAWAVLAEGSSASSRLILLLPAEIASALAVMLRARLLDDEATSLSSESWSGLSEPEVVAHLRVLTGESAAERLHRWAPNLLEQARGGWEALGTVLRRAAETGRLRAEGAVWKPVGEHWWLDGEGQDAEQAALASLSEDARALLAAVVLLEQGADGGRAVEVSALEAVRAEAAEAELRWRGALPAGSDWTPNARWSVRILCGLDGQRRSALRRRGAEVLAATGATTLEVARLRALLATDDEALEAVCAVAETERLAGRLGSARRLLERTRTVRPHADEPAETERRVLEARIEIAEGRGEAVVDGLEAQGIGPQTQGAESLRLVAALAAEQCGKRDLARALYGSVGASAVRTDHRLWALLGLAYGDLLDGDTEAADERLADVSLDGAPTEVAAAILNLRGVIGVRLGDHERAEADLEAAHRVAEQGGDRAAMARSAVNRAYLDRRRGQLRRAVLELERAYAQFATMDLPAGRSLALNNLGVLLRDLGDCAGARARLAQSLMLRRRIGDAHGAMSSLSSIALCALDAGEVGAALDLLDRADELARRGGYGAERGQLDLQRRTALALAGRDEDGLDAEGLAQAEGEHPVIARRLGAAEAFARGRLEQARRRIRAAESAARASGDVAECFRAAATWVSLDRAEPTAAAALTAALSPLADSEVRVAESAWRLAATTRRPSLDELEAWYLIFEGAGRTDLARVVSRAAVVVAQEAGEIAVRRRAAQRSRQAADALTDGLDRMERSATLRRIDALAGGPLWPEQGAGLGVEWYLECNRRMASERDLPGLLGTIVDAALELTRARRAFLMVRDEAGVDVEVARARGAGSLPSEDVGFSRTVVARALDEGTPLLVTDASRDQRFAGTRSIDDLSLRSILCVPFRGQDGVEGALYVDDEADAGVFDEADLEGVRSLADQAAMAITNLRRREQIEALNRRLSERVQHQAEELDQARSRLRRRGDAPPVVGLVGESEPILEVARMVERFAPTDLPVLVTGPSGTGKDIVARALHHRSPRADGPLLIENVAAVPAALLESEMFGHVRGAFTGADRDRTGLFAEADGGTFVLDEVGEMPLELQAKLLRVLESGEFRPVGSRETFTVDVRVVAVTNRDLLSRARAGEFREDLYYRLNAAEILMPSLADRLEDVPLLVRHFVERLNAEHETTKTVDDAVLAAFMRRSWPGNVRELSNEIARVYFLSGARLDDPSLVRPMAPVDGDRESMPESLRLEDVERAAIERALKATEGRKDRAATLLGISRAGLYTKLRRLGLSG